MKTIDVRGLLCPEPMMLVKQEIDKSTEEFIVLADNKAAVENIQRLLTLYGWQFNLTSNNHEFQMKVYK